MKRLSLSAGLLSLLLALSLWHGSYVEQLTHETETALICAQEYACRGDWSGALDRTLDALESWQAQAPYLHTTLRHQENDQILRSFLQVIQYLRLEEMDQYAAANADLICQLNLLGEMEAPSLSNIL